MFNQNHLYAYTYVVLIEHTCKTQNVLILLFVLILFCLILVVYFRAKQSNNIAFLLKNTGKIQDKPH